MSDKEEIWEEMQNIIKGDGLHELINDMIDNLDQDIYVGLRDLFLDEDGLDRAQEILFAVLMNEWNEQAKKRLEA